MVNGERKDELKGEKEKLAKTEDEFKSKISEYNQKINTFENLSNSMKKRVEKQEKDFKIFNTVAEEYEGTLMEFNFLAILTKYDNFSAAEVSDCQKEIKNIEWEIADYRSNLGKYQII